MSHRLLLFDLDDTLCDYASARDQRLRIALGGALAESGRGAEIDLEAVIAESIAIHPHGADHFEDLLERFGVRERRLATRAKDWYQTNRFHGLRLFPDALDLLTAVRNTRPDRRLGLITNGPADVQRAKVDLLDLHAYLDFILISGELGHAKPHPEIFREALRLGEALPEETVVIGDSAEFDIAGAKAAGMGAIWMNRTGNRWRFNGPPPDHEVESLTDLLPILVGAP